MGSIYYNMFVSAILLFPWSVVGIMILGAVWERGKVCARARVRR